MIWSRAFRAARRKPGAGGGWSVRENISILRVEAHSISPDPMTSQRRELPTRLSVLVVVASFGVTACAREGEGNLSRFEGASVVGWSHYGGDSGSNRWSSLEQVSEETIESLEPAWIWESGESRRATSGGDGFVAPGVFQATPIIFGDTLYTSTPFNRVVALDARSGQELWSFDPGATRAPLVGVDRGGFVHRGVASWEGTGGRRIFIGSRWELISLDAQTGMADPSFGVHGRVDLRPGLRWAVDSLEILQTSPPAVWENIVVVGSRVGDRLIESRDPPGAVQAFDTRTGRSLWIWDPIPGPGEPGRDSWVGESAEVTGHVNVWAPMSVDDQRGLIFLPVSAPSNDWYGGKRLGDNLHSQSVVALDIRTGEAVWHQQLIHHDVWDYDLATAPVLVTLPVTRARKDGEVAGSDAQQTDLLDAVIVATKTGFLFAFDRVDGTPLWPMEERSVPSSDVPGERLSGTQPHGLGPRAFAQQGFAREDVVDFSPEVSALALDLLEGVGFGPLFTPPSLEGSVIMPGWIGGAGWGSVAVDPVRGVLLVKATNSPTLARLLATEDDRGFVLDPELPGGALTLTLPEPWWWIPGWRRDWRIPVTRPPYGTLTAFDLATGEISWQVPAGRNRQLERHPAIRAAGLGDLGTIGSPGGITTASGLTFLAGGGTELIAYDTESGRVVWSHPLEGQGFAVPATYSTSDGRQYVVVGVGTFGLQAFALR